MMNYIHQHGAGLMGVIFILGAVVVFIRCWMWSR